MSVVVVRVVVVAAAGASLSSLAGCGRGSDAAEKVPAAAFPSTRTEGLRGRTEPLEGWFPEDPEGLDGFRPRIGVAAGATWRHPEALGLSPLGPSAADAGREVVRFVEMPTWMQPYAIEVEVDAAMAGRPDAPPWLPEPGVGGEEADVARGAYAAWAQERAGWIRYAVLDGSGGYEPGDLAAEGRRVLTRSGLHELRSRLDAADLFHERAEDLTIGADGSSWTVEVLVGGRYHVVNRWSPSLDDHSSRGTRAFVELAAWLREQAVPRPLRARNEAAS